MKRKNGRAKGMSHYAGVDDKSPCSLSNASTAPSSSTLADILASAPAEGTGASAARIAASASIEGALGISGRIVMSTVAGGDVTGEPMIVSRFGGRAIRSCGGRDEERRRVRERTLGLGDALTDSKGGWRGVVGALSLTGDGGSAGHCAMESGVALMF